MPGMVAHACQLAHQLRHARQRPQFVVIASRRRALNQRLGDLLLLFGAQTGFAPGRALAAQGRGSAGLPLLEPIVGGLAPNAQTTGDFGRADMLFKEGARLQTACFHGGVIAGLVLHAMKLSYPVPIVSLLYEAQ